MQYLKSAVQYYKDINPATLTGAIDVIVVERPASSSSPSTDGAVTSSGATNEVELACSPFHVRFGKLSVLRPIDKKVRIVVNDEEVPFFMKVGETGEAFFVFETDENVPDDLQTSPISSPAAPGEPQEATDEPDFLDLNASATNEGAPLSSPTESSPTSSQYVSLAATAVQSPAETRRTFSTPVSPGLVDDAPLHEDPNEEQQPRASKDSSKETTKAKTHSFVPSALTSAFEKVAGLGGAAGQAAAKHGPHDASLKKVVEQEHGDAASKTAGAGDDHSQAESTVEDEDDMGKMAESMRRTLEGTSIGDKKKEPGEDVRNAAREKFQDVRDILGGTSGLGRVQSQDGGFGSAEFSQQVSQTGPHSAAEEAVFTDKTGLQHELAGAHPEHAGDLMLDMAGYKIEENEGESGQAGDHPNQNNAAMVNALDEKAEEEVMAFTQALLQCSDPKTLRNFFDPSDERSSRATSPEPFLPSDDDRFGRASTPLSGRLRADSRASSPPRPTSKSSLQTLRADGEGDISPADGMFHATPKQFTLKVGSKVHVFELSLCGGGDIGEDKKRDDLVFAEHQVTFSQFMEHADVCDHHDLVVKYGDRFLTWDNAPPLLASLSVYRKSLVEHPEHHKHFSSSEDETKRTSRGWRSWWSSRGTAAQSVATDNQSQSSAPLSHTTPPTSSPPSPPDSPRSMPLPDKADSSPPASPPFVAQDAKGNNKHYAKTLRLTSDQLKSLNLKKGMNTITFSVRSSYSGYATCASRVFLWESDHSVVISDIDGTITKSDALGHVFTMIGRDWTHLGVAKLYTDIARNGYKMMYLTSRAIGQADTTREYLKGISQNGYKLPEGPVIMSPDRLMTSLHREVIMRKPEVFKMACLRDIQRLFHERSPFYAGFGNRITDALSYRSVDVPSSRIFTIDSNGEVKMELLELAGYKSSYIHMTDLVDQMFPPINRKAAPEFTDFNFWKAPLPQFDLPDLTPPSPALSARSDSSRLGFTRLGSLASSLSRRGSRGTLADGGAGTPNSNGDVTPGSTTAGGSVKPSRQTPSSPLLQATLVEEPSGLEEDDMYDDDAFDGRSESDSMPGSLPHDTDFEKLRAAALAKTGRKDEVSEAEQYKKQIKRSKNLYDVDLERGDGARYGEEDDGGDEDENEEVEADEFADQMDFSSVPPLASEIGLSILKQGGNAADAGVAIAAALNVTEPCNCGIGGDVFCLFYDAKARQVKALNGSGRSPRALSLAKARELGLDGPFIPASNINAATVPGAAAAWCDIHENFGSGKLSMQNLLQPAIDLANKGFAVGSQAAAEWVGSEKLLKKAALGGKSDMLLDDDKAPRAGEVFSNPNLAKTFETLAQQGKKGFYEGRIAHAIADAVQKRGGVMEVEDLKSHESAFVEPISYTYDKAGVTVHECPPAGQGLAALIAFGILDVLQEDGVIDLDRTEEGSAEWFHPLIEAIRLAFADIHSHVGDPDFSYVPVKELLSKDYLRSRAKLFNKDRAAAQYEQGRPIPSSDTVYFAAADGEGNAISMIMSNFAGFGTGVVPDGCGFTLQNRGSGFFLTEEGPNRLEGGKRPFHTIIPAMATKGDELLASFGVMGGRMQPQGHVQTLSNLLHLSHNPQAALDAPRFCVGGPYPSTTGPLYFNGPVSLEEGVKQETVDALAAKGHQVEIVGGKDRILFGKGQQIVRTVDRRTGRRVWVAGSDPRGDGCALPML
ncbi:lipin Ned1 [Microbotryomycetes sp. JL221]|nr:lipin Ned1 [Microbotryomycetes sp. JL221]